MQLREAAKHVRKQMLDATLENDCPWVIPGSGRRRDYKPHRRPLWA